MYQNLAYIAYKEAYINAYFMTGKKPPEFIEEFSAFWTEEERNEAKVARLKAALMRTQK